MKRCPTCKTTYTDDGLRFCLADGATLTPVSDEEPTVYSGRRGNVRIDIQREPPPSFQAPLPESIGSSGRWIKILLVILLLGFLGIVIAGVAGFMFYYNSGRDDRDIASKTPTATPVPSITLDPEKQRLQDELANMQKKLDEQKKTNVNTQSIPTPNKPGVPTARVNSPGDGFLALRSEPDAEYGERLAKIPHGGVVELNNCEKTKVTIGGKTGRWCLVTYKNHTGYVFDPFLIY